MHAWKILYTELDLVEYDFPEQVTVGVLPPLPYLTRRNQYDSLQEDSVKAG